jgi:dipeptidyl aminopeptidase/acylaminoacyl peptidase
MHGWISSEVVMRLCVYSLAVFLFALPLVAQSKHPFTFEDMMALKRVEEPEVSPDGKWVLFAAVDVDLKANTKTPHVWVVPLNQTQGPSTSLGMTGGEREIISDQDADRPRWAPDGKRFAFLSTKENGSQIWIADFDGATGTVTDKHKLTFIGTEADGELWSPDGKSILFKSDVYPECDDGVFVREYNCNLGKLDQAKKSKVKAQIFTHLLYRHWNAYKEGKRTHLFVIPAPAADETWGPLKDPRQRHYANLAFYRDLTPGDYDAPVFSLGGQDDYAFSPDGQDICYASNHDAEPAISTNNDLFTVPVNFPPDATSKDVLAATKDITVENKAADNTPLYSPDGKYIAYRAQQRPGYESDRFRLMLYDRATGRKKDLTTSLDNWVGTFTWGPDSSKLYFASEVKGQSWIYVVEFKHMPKPDSDGSTASTNNGFEHRVVVDTIRITRRSVVRDGFDDDPALASEGNILLVSQMSIDRPVEIYSQSLLTKTTCNDRNSGEPQPGDCGHPTKLEPLTHINDALLSSITMSTLQRFMFHGANDDYVEGFLVKPPNFDSSKKYPVKFLIHGGPQGAWGDDWSYRWNPELFAANGYVVIMINFHGSTGYGQKFIDAINGDWGGAPFEDLMKGLDYAEQHYPFIDKDRECALGASYGGYMANWILGHTNRFKCIVTHDGMFNTESAWGDTEELWFNEWEFKGTPYTNREMYRKWSPQLFATNFKTPTLVIHSQLDYRLDVSQGFDLFTTLQRQGVPSKMLYFPDEGHWVLKPQNSELWYKTVNDWVDQWVK